MQIYFSKIILVIFFVINYQRCILRNSARRPVGTAEGNFNKCIPNREPPRRVVRNASDLIPRRRRAWQEWET